MIIDLELVLSEPEAVQRSLYRAFILAARRSWRTKAKSLPLVSPSFGQIDIDKILLVEVKRWTRERNRI